MEVFSRLMGTSGVCDALPGIPVVELAGERRVLIEGHLGVTAYCPDCIRVKMSYGSICVEGSGLTLAHMSKERLVVMGCIHRLCLCREGKHA